jgi:hemolysin III
MSKAAARLAARHYPTRCAKRADGWVHGVGIALGALGGLTLLGLALGVADAGTAVSVAIYAVCILVMLGLSAAYNFANERSRPLLRRFDHAGIFLMIAGSYTPFTTQKLEGAWAIGMTTAVWTLALAGVAGKLFLPGLGRKFWVALYLLLGWLAVVALKPLLAGVSILSLLLLAVGGLIYSTGVLVYLKHSLKFRRAIWHGFVVAAAGVQYAAVLTGVVLPHAR